MILKNITKIKKILDFILILILLILFIKIPNIIYSQCSQPPGEVCTVAGSGYCVCECTTTVTDTTYSTINTTTTSTVYQVITKTNTVYTVATSTSYTTTTVSTTTVTSTVTTTATSTTTSIITNTQNTTTTITTTSTITNYTTTTTTTTIIYSSIIYLHGILNIDSINQTFYRSISFPIQPGSTIFYLNITNSGNATINNITLSFSVIGNSVILSYNKLPVTTLNNITISSPLQPNNSLIIPFNMLVMSPGLTDVDIGVYVNGQYKGYGNYQFNVEQGSFSPNSSPGLVVSENINYILLSLAGILGLLLLI